MARHDFGIDDVCRLCHVPRKGVVEFSIVCAGSVETPRPRPALRGAFGCPPSLEGVTDRIASSTLLTPRRELLERR